MALLSSSLRIVARTLVFLLAALLAAGAAQAQSTNITASLAAEHSAMPGETVTLAIDMRPAQGWHGYWINPGDAPANIRHRQTLAEVVQDLVRVSSFPVCKQVYVVECGQFAEAAE